MKKVFYFLVFIISLTGCSSENDPDNTSEYFASSKILEGSSVESAIDEEEQFEEAYRSAFGIESLKKFTVEGGKEQLKKLCEKAEANVSSLKLEGSYSMNIMSSATLDTVYTFRTPSSNRWYEPWTVGATYYVSEVFISCESDKKTALNNLSKCDVVREIDLNNGTEGDYVFLGFNRSQANKGKDLVNDIIVVLDSKPEEVYFNQRIYKPVVSYGRDNGNLNAGTSGRKMYLYQSYDDLAIFQPDDYKKLINNIHISTSKIMSNFISLAYGVYKSGNVASDSQNVNEGVGSVNIYIEIFRFSF